MNIPSPVRIALAVIATALPPAAAHASVRLSTHGSNPGTHYRTTSGWALPEGDWTVGIWDNHFEGDGGWLVGFAAPDNGGSMNLFFDRERGRYFVGGQDAAGNRFGTDKINGVEGSLAAGYPGRPSGVFMPRLHIIRRREGRSEYLVAEAGHAPVLVASEERPFGATAAGNWCVGANRGVGPCYDGDLEGFFLANSAVNDADVALMAAGLKPSSVASLKNNLRVYVPLEDTGATRGVALETPVPNLGAETAITLKLHGARTSFGDGPMLRGATAANQRPNEVAEPAQVVALNSFQPFQIIRHHKGAADITFTGFDYGTGPANIQLRFIDDEHPKKNTAWQTLAVGSRGGGSAVKATISVPKGYWQTMEVRRVRPTGDTAADGRPVRTWCRWAVGEVVVVWGDSIQGQVDGNSRVNKVPANGFTAKYPTSITPGIPGDANPLAKGAWNLLRGSGMGGGSQGENLIANNLSAASGCCVGISVFWAGASRLDYWNGRTSSNAYNAAKATMLANDGLNKPGIITWVGNCASAKLDANASAYYSDFDLFKKVLDADLGADTWRLLIMPMPITYAPDTTTALGAHKVREACWRWARDHPDVGAFAGISLDHLTKDGVHPTDEAWDHLGPRWANAAAHLRDPANHADPRAGEFTGFRREGNDLIAEARLFAGTALTVRDPAASISGFTLSADNFRTLLPIRSATLLNATHVRITPEHPLPATPLKLRYLYGNPGEDPARKAPADPIAAGTNNLLYVNAGPSFTLAVSPIWGDEGSFWSLEENR